MQYQQKEQTYLIWNHWTQKPRYMTFYIQVQWNGMANSIMGSQTPSDREWLLIGANSAIFRSWIFIVLAHWNNSLWIDISPHSVTLSWFRANQSLIFLLNNVYMSEESTTTKVTYDWGWRTLVLILNALFRSCKFQ